MKTIVLIARLLLGLMFTVFGLNGFLHFIPAPMQTGLASQFLGALVASHYHYFVFAIQLIGGILLLINQYVPLALVLLGAVIANILTFHITMQPAGIPPGLLALVLWLVVTYWHRAAFAPLLAPKTIS